MCGLAIRDMLPAPNPGKGANACTAKQPLAVDASRAG